MLNYPLNVLLISTPQITPQCHLDVGGSGKVQNSSPLPEQLLSVLNDTLFRNAALSMQTRHTSVGAANTQTIQKYTPILMFELHMTRRPLVGFLILGAWNHCIHLSIKLSTCLLACPSTTCEG